MGNASSSLSSLTKEEIATSVASHGAKYESYADAVRDNGVNGDVLASLDNDEELIEIFDELEITSKLHRKVLTKALHSARKTPSNPPPAPGAPSQTKEADFKDIPEYFKAAAEYNLTIDTPANEVEGFDQIVQEVLAANPKAKWAFVNLILEDAQHPIGGRMRQPGGCTISDRKVANVPNKDSICYFLVHDPTRDILIRDLPEGNPWGATYLGHVLRDRRTGARVGALCQIAFVPDEEDKNEQIMLLQRLAATAEEQLEERKVLNDRRDSLMAQLASCSGDEVILPSHGPVEAVTAAQVRAAPPSDFPSPDEVRANGRPRNSSALPAYCRGLAKEEDRQHLPPDFFDAVDAAGMIRPPIAHEDMERVAAVEALGLHRMDPDGPVASSLRNLVETAAQIFRFPLAQISYHNHAKEFSLCPYRYGSHLTEKQKAQCDDFVDETLVKDSTGAPFLGCRGRGNAVCNYPILTKKTFVVHDLWEDEAFTMYKDLQFIRSYVGVPIISSERHVVAMLCMFDFVPRPNFEKAHELQAENIARIIAQTIENWSLRLEIERLEKERRLVSMRVENDKRFPPTGEASFVITDVQGSTVLWEQDACAMQAALKIHDTIMRKCCAEAFGYEITTEGDSFFLAFHDPVDAISFAVRAQTELYWAAWSQEVLELSDAAVDSNNSFRGLRVRMGVHHGPVSISHHEVTGRVQYTGQTCKITKSTEGMSHGGQILVTVDAWRAASTLIDSLCAPQVLDLGEHVVMTGSSISEGIIAKRILQLVPKELSFDYSLARHGEMPRQKGMNEKERAEKMLPVKGRQFPPPITKRKLSASFHEAPYVDGLVTIVFVLSPGLESLSDEIADATVTAVGKLLRPLLLETSGYECKGDRGSWMIAFDAPLQAVRFGLSLVSAVQSAATLDNSVDRGGLIKVGVHAGSFRSMCPHPTTGRADYFGPVVNRAARVSGAAASGEVYIGVPAGGPEEEEGILEPNLGPSIVATFEGVKTLRGVTEQMSLFSCRSMDTSTLVPYFAIGAMMNPISVANRGIHPVNSQAAELLDYRLGFFSAMGFADAVPCSGASLHGVIHYVEPDQMEILDKIEVFYTRHSGARAQLYNSSDDGDDGNKETIILVNVYVHQDSRGPRDISEDTVPKERYLDVLIAGAKHHGVKPSYIEWLKNHEKIPRKSPGEYSTLPFHGSFEDLKVLAKDDVEKNDGFEGRPLWLSINGKVIEAQFPAQHSQQLADNRQRYKDHGGRIGELYLAKLVYDPKFGTDHIESMRDVTPEYAANCEDFFCEILAVKNETDYWKVVGRIER